MPLAGKVRLKTFVLGMVGLTTVVGGGVFAFVNIVGAVTASGTPSREAKAREYEAVVSAENVVSREPSSDEVVFSYRGQGVSNGKIKDVLPSATFKINLYQDAEFATMNRAKVDLDRDEKWDEKWTFDQDGGISKRVAPSDDENYTQEWVWTDGEWTSASEIAAAPAVDEEGGETLSPGGESWRMVDQILIVAAGSDLGGANKRKDITAEMAFKVNVYQDEGHAVMNRAKVDLDRDEQWDEKWTFKLGEITRQVSPEDDGNYTQNFRWTGQGWEAY